MKYTVYSFFFFTISTIGFAQYRLECIINLEGENNLKPSIKIYDKQQGLLMKYMKVKFLYLKIEFKKILIYSSLKAIPLLKKKLILVRLINLI
jgi:hypothetical protein